MNDDSKIKLYKIHDRETGKDAAWEGKAIVFHDVETASKFIEEFSGILFNKTYTKIRYNTYDEENIMFYEDIPKEELEAEKYIDTGTYELEDDEYLVPVQYAVTGIIKVQAESVSEACAKIIRDKGSNYPFPANVEPVKGSLKLAYPLIEAQNTCMEITEAVRDEIKNMKEGKKDDENNGSQNSGSI